MKKEELENYHTHNWKGLVCLDCGVHIFHSFTTGVYSYYHNAHAFHNIGLETDCNKAMLKQALE